MVKTTIILDDDIYKQLVEEAIERYGSTRTLSRLINEKLKEPLESPKGPKRRRSTVRLGREFKPEEIEKMAEEGWKEATRWTP